jgi:cyclase
MTRSSFRSTLVAVTVLSIACVTVQAQNDFSGVEIKTIPVSGHVYMLTGAGGNLGLSVGDNGAFLIDDQFAPLTPKIKAAVAALTDKPVTFLVNTHWHGDHVGGNENFGDTGSIIVAHENVRKRMSVEQAMGALGGRKVPASPAAALPVITFPETMSFHWNGDDIRVIHVAHAHTDGDSLIYFTKANVIHMGDTFFNGMYPFIDYGSGGVIDGVIDAADKAISMADGETKIIPGHGTLTDLAGLKTYRDMLAKIRDRMARLIKKGKSIDEIVEAGITAEWDEEWGQSNFTPPEKFVRAVHEGMIRAEKRK